MIATILTAKPSDKLLNSLKNIDQLQQEDEKISKIIKNCQKSKYKTFELIDNTLFKNGKLVVPNSIIDLLITEIHNIYMLVQKKPSRY